jgi:DedD protein
MDQELKQRLIGAAVITALAAIFVPMLFDDPIDETGKNISQLTIPEIPAKAQDVEIIPLPDKAEEVATALPPEESLKTVPPLVEEGVRETDVEAPKPKLRLTGREPHAAAAKHLKVVEPNPSLTVGDDEQPIAEAEEASPAVKHTKLPAPAPTPVLPNQVTNTPPAPKAVKPAVKVPENNVAVENTAKPLANETGTRWYLNAGSFGQKVNAQALQDNLKQQGFPATIKEVTGEKGTVFKVRVGPMLDKAKAQAVKNKLTQININSFVSPDE